MTFDAPRHLVFDAMTQPEHVTRWFGCAEFALPVCEIDLRVGGAYRFVMRSPDGVDSTLQGVYRDVVRPERVVFTERVLDARIYQRRIPGHLDLRRTVAARPR